MSQYNSNSSTNYIIEYYLSKGLDTPFDSWEITKKYKNFRGQICRDFINRIQHLRAIFVEDENCENPIIIENENFEFFLRSIATTPVFYYVPAICNNGLVFIMVPSKQFDLNSEIPPFNSNSRLLLEKKLLTLFKEDDLFSIGSSLIFAFPNTDMDDVIRKLERNQITFNLKLVDKIDTNYFQPLIPDVSLSSFRFPQDTDLNNEESISIIFKILSTNQNLGTEDYARIKFLLKKIKPSDFNIVKKISMDFRNTFDPKLNSIFDYEGNRKKAQDLVKRAWVSQKISEQ